MKNLLILLSTIVLISAAETWSGTLSFSTQTIGVVNGNSIVRFHNLTNEQHLLVVRIGGNYDSVTLDGSINLDLPNYREYNNTIVPFNDGDSIYARSDGGNVISYEILKK